MGQAGAVFTELRPSQRHAPPVAMSGYHAAFRAFGDVAAALNELRDLDTLLHLIAARICELAGTQRGGVYLRDEKTGLFRGQVAHANHNIDEEVKRLVAGTEADRLTQEIVNTKRPVVVSNALEDPRPIRAAMRAWNVRSMLGVPMVLRGEVIGIVFLDAEDERCTFTEETIEVASTFADLAAVAIAQAQMTGELRRCLTTVSRQNKVLRRASAVDDRLSTLALDGASFAEIAEAVADLAAKPCAIYDAAHRLLGGATPSWLDQAGSPRMPEPAAWLTPPAQHALQALGEKSCGIVGPIREAGLQHRFLVARVTSRDNAWGWLVVMEHGTRFGPLDAHITRRAATHIALEMAAEARAARGEWDARASLLSELIRGNFDVRSLARRAQYLGADLAAPRVLCLVGPAAPGEGSMPSAAEVSAAFANAGMDGVLAAGVAEGVVVAVALEAAVSVREALVETCSRVERVLPELRHGLNLVAAISACCHCPQDYVRAYAETTQVMACITTLSLPHTGRVLAADDLGPGRLFLASATRADAERFARDALGVLLSAEEGMDDLLLTRRVFFDNARSVRRSAHQLAVHENTIRYRLARVEKLTGLEVASDSEDQLTVQLALLILRISGGALEPAATATLTSAPT